MTLFPSRTLSPASISRSWLVLGGSLLLACQSKSLPGPQPGLTQSVSPAPVNESPIVAEIELANPSEFERSKEPAFFSYYDLGLASDDARRKTLAVRVRASAGSVGASEGIVPSQAVDTDGDGTKDGVLALIDLAPAATVKLDVVSDPAASSLVPPRLTQAEIARKAGGEWKPRQKDPKLKEYVGGRFENVKELTPPPEHTDHSNFIRYEGPGIESDKVAYRIYLDERNGFDIFGKKAPEPVLHKVGLDGYESYHHMAEWGMDILKVGLSLGTGGFGFWDGKRVQIVSKVKGWDASVLEDGPLYSAFRIKYKGWQIDGKTLDATADYSMTGGSRLVHASIRLSEALPNLAIGIVKHPETELIKGSTDVTGKAYTYVGSFGKQSLNEDHLGMAVIFRNEALDSQVTDEANYVAVVEPAGARFDYYFLAAWELEPGGIKTQEEFVKSLEHEIERLTLPPRERVQTALSARSVALPVTADSALAWAKKLADSELERKALSYAYDGWDENRQRKPKFEYDIVGLQPMAYDELAQVSPEPKYREVIAKVAGSYVDQQGNIATYKDEDYNIDAIAPGRNLLRLYEQTKLEQYKLASQHLRHQLEKHPKTSQGAFWHKKRYPWQLWLDGVYMGMPFLAHYSVLFEGGKSLPEVVNEFVVTREHLRDPKTGLYFHGWDEKKEQSWADPKTGLSREIWGRGLGWYSMAVIDVLDFIPESEVKLRQPLLDIVQELAPALVKYQDPETGTWWQVMDKPQAPGNYRESSASAMFAYFFAKAVRKGYLPASYRETAQKSFEGLLKEFVTVHADGKISMTNQCLVGGLGYGRDGSYRYYMSEPVWKNDPKGNGPFILAGVELHRLLSKPN